MDNLNFEELNNLTDEERKAALKILEEYSQQGKSRTYTDLILADYNEVPVDIVTFLHNPKYLGKALISEDGKYTVFPYWEKVLQNIFPDPLRPAQYNTAIFTGAIGLGKSTIAVIAGCYELYRMLCLKNPYTYYGIQEVDKITFAVINITKDAAHGVAWTKMQNMLKSSEWFLDHGSLTRSDPPEWRPPESIELIYGSKPSHIIGRALFWCFQDEVSFRQNMDVEKQKEAAAELVNSASARMQSRFMKGEKNPTLLILASSKRTEQSYLESFIEKKKQNESSTTLIVDEPQWVIRTDKNSDKKFKVALGNKFLDSEVLPLNISPLDEKYYIDRGYTIIDVPIGYYENFIDDIDIALTDIAGISTSNVTKYISGSRLLEVKDPLLKNPFNKNIITVGNAKDDTAQYYDFFDMNCIPDEMKYKPLYIHLDMSITGDKTGIAGVWIVGKKPTVQGQPANKDLFYQTAFSVSVKAPKGYQISFEKNRQFIRWLKSQGFNIRVISSDTYQSADLLQQLSSEGYNTEVISVDRVKDNICIPYQVFKSAIYEERIRMYDSKLLTEEIVGLERNNNGKIDHSPAGINSKDQADAVCLHGDTEIFLLSGKHKTIEQLYDERDSLEEWVIAYNTHTSKLEPVKICDVVDNGVKNNLIKLTLDNGQFIVCTDDHKILTRQGDYVEAKDTLGISLMPFTYENKKMYKNGYYTYVYNPNSDLTSSGVYLHRLVAEQMHGKNKCDKLNSINDGEWLVIHHKDCNKLNNNPDNLEYLTNVEHSMLHRKLNSSDYKKKKLSEFNHKLAAEGKHPFQNLSDEVKAKLKEEGRKHFIEYNKSEKHRNTARINNAKLVSNGVHNFQLYKEHAHSIEANNKRKATCNVRYGGDNPFCSAEIQTKCRASCLSNNGYDNPMHSSEMQYIMKLNRLKSAFEKVQKYYGMDDNDYLSLMDFKLGCYALNISGVSQKPEDILNAHLNIDISDYNDDLYAIYRTKGNCIRQFIKDTGKSSFIMAEFDDWFNQKCTQDRVFKYRFNRFKPLYEDMLKLGFNVYNHRVVSIEPMPSGHVYDLKLDKIHNFALTSGIFVHNCGAVFSASQHAEEFAFEYGEHLDVMTDVSTTVSEADLKKQIQVDFEQELQRAFANSVQTSAISQPQQLDMNMYYLSQGIII